jgi:DnaJ-class molecular chaperone
MPKKEDPPATGKCFVCSGRGWVIIREPGTNNSIKATCVACEGTGMK